jgi:hypothetical protein
MKTRWLFDKNFLIYIPDLEKWFAALKTYVQKLLEQRAMNIALILNLPETYKERRRRDTTTMLYGKRKKKAYRFVPINKVYSKALLYLPPDILQLIYEFIFRENILKEKIITQETDIYCRIKSVVKIEESYPKGKVMQRLCFNYNRCFELFKDRHTGLTATKSIVRYDKNLELSRVLQLEKDSLLVRDVVGSGKLQKVFKKNLNIMV